MGAVIMHNVVSVDGFIADANDQVGPLFDWYVNGDVEIIDGGQMRVSQPRPITSRRCGRASGRW